ncbi:hypothetical protein M885DRAFT_524880 [Pelagophyceae sp. CCMP2097]|nr:hypothetical protein M885DRAFT_524880 [Pelagophyceae sp. CCMP2097]
MARAPSASRVMRIARRTVSASQRVRSVRRNDAGVRPQAPRRFISSCALFEDARTFEVRRTNVRTGASRDASRDAPSCTRLARVPTAAVSVGAAVLAASREAACRFVGAASRGRRRGAVPRLGAEACGPRRAVSLLQRRRRQVVANRPIVANRRRRPVVVVAVVVVVEMPRRRVEQRGSVVLGVDSCVWRHRRDKVVSRRKCNKAVRRGERLRRGEDRGLSGRRPASELLLHHSVVSTFAHFIRRRSMPQSLGRSGCGSRRGRGPRSTYGGIHRSCFLRTAATVTKTAPPARIHRRSIQSRCQDHP